MRKYIVITLLAAVLIFVSAQAPSKDQPKCVSMSVTDAGQHATIFLAYEDGSVERVYFEYVPNAKVSETWVRKR